MTSILSWNIQNGKGVDDHISLARITDVISGMGTPDVICLQEVSRGLELSDGYAPDQLSELAELFPEYEIVFGIAVDALCQDSNQRWQFGNVTLSRLPILARTTHVLPSPAIEGLRYMTRQATEVVVEAPAGALRVVTTDLASGPALADVELEIFDFQDQRLATGRSDAQGFATLALDRTPFYLVARRGEQRATR